MIAKTLDTVGRIDILVNTADGNLRSHEEQSASSTTKSHYTYIMDIKLTATIHCCQAVSVPMQEAGSGKIVNVASQSGVVERGRWRRHALQGCQSQDHILHAGTTRPNCDPAESTSTPSPPA